MSHHAPCSLRLVFPVMLLLSLLAATGCDLRGPDVRKAMTRLIIANEAGDADTVASMYSNSTIQHYDNLLRLAREAKRDQIIKLPLEQQLSVLGMRRSMTLAEMKKLDGREYIKKCVRDGTWAVEWGVEDYGPIKFTGDTAWMEVKEPDARGPRLGRRRWLSDTRKTFYIRFYFEDDTWKLDETSLSEFWNSLLVDAAREARMNYDRFLFSVLEDDEGKPPPPTIWDPPKK